MGRLDKLFSKSSSKQWPMISVTTNEELCTLLQEEQGSLILGSIAWSPEFEALIYKLQHPYQALTAEEETYIRSDVFQTEISHTSKTINTLLLILHRSGQHSDYLLNNGYINPEAVIAQHQHAYATTQAEIEKVVDKISSQKTKLQQLQNQISNITIEQSEQIADSLAILDSYTDINYEQISQIQGKLDQIDQCIAEHTKLIYVLPKDRQSIYSRLCDNKNIKRALLQIRDRSGNLICKNGQIDNILTLLGKYRVDGGVEYDTIPGLTGVTIFPKIKGNNVVNTFYPMNTTDLKSLTGVDVKSGHDDYLCKISDSGPVNNCLNVYKRALTDTHNDNTLTPDNWIDQDPQGNPNYIRDYALHLQKKGLTLNKKKPTQQDARSISRTIGYPSRVRSR